MAISFASFAKWAGLSLSAAEDMWSKSKLLARGSLKGSTLWAHVVGNLKNAMKLEDVDWIFAGWAPRLVVEATSFGTLQLAEEADSKHSPELICLFLREFYLCEALGEDSPFVELTTSGQVAGVPGGLAKIMRAAGDDKKILLQQLSALFPGATHDFLRRAVGDSSAA